MYGVKISRSGLACCPFHTDTNPSMKLDERYYCFGCGATGDAVDLTAKLLNLNPKEAALQLAADFMLELPSRESITPPERASPGKRTDEWRNNSIDTLVSYRHLLQTWEKEYAPQSMDAEWHPLFCEALQEKAYIDYLLDELFCCSEEQLDELKRCISTEVVKIEERVRKSLSGRAEKAGRRVACQGAFSPEASEMV